MKLRRYTHTARLMGSSFELGVVTTSRSLGLALLEEGVLEIQRIERMLTEFDPASVTCRLNAAPADQFFQVPDEFTQLLSRCKGIHQLTKGYFDITVAPLKAIYKFNNQEFRPPSNEDRKSALNRTGMNAVEIGPKGIKHGGRAISFASIGKGYAADRVRQAWKKKDIAGGYINASGDLCAFGHNEKGDNWNIGIAHPEKMDSSLLHIPLTDAAVATSGDYQQHFTYKGKRYSHNINPKTGYPVQGITSITVVSPSAELSDALATAVHAMGISKGLRLVEQLPSTHLIAISTEGKIHLSKKLDYAPIP